MEFPVAWISLLLTALRHLHCTLEYKKTVDKSRQYNKIGRV